MCACSISRAALLDACMEDSTRAHICVVNTGVKENIRSASATTICWVWVSASSALLHRIFSFRNWFDGFSTHRTVHSSSVKNRTNLESDVCVPCAPLIFIFVRWNAGVRVTGRVFFLCCGSRCEFRKCLILENRYRLCNRSAPAVVFIYKLPHHSTQQSNPRN